MKKFFQTIVDEVVLFYLIFARFMAQNRLETLIDELRAEAQVPDQAGSKERQEQIHIEFMSVEHKLTVLDSKIGQQEKRLGIATTATNGTNLKSKGAL